MRMTNFTMRSIISRKRKTKQKRSNETHARTRTNIPFITCTKVLLLIWLVCIVCSWGGYFYEWAIFNRTIKTFSLFHFSKWMWPSEWVSVQCTLDCEYKIHFPINVESNNSHSSNGRWKSCSENECMIFVSLNQGQCISCRFKLNQMVAQEWLQLHIL